MPKTKKQLLDRCRSGNDFRKVAHKRGADIREGTNHTIIETRRGRTHIPRHPGDLRKGTQRSIYKALMVILTLIFACIYLFLLSYQTLPAQIAH